MEETLLSIFPLALISSACQKVRNRTSELKLKYVIDWLIYRNKDKFLLTIENLGFLILMLADSRAAKGKYEAPPLMPLFLFQLDDY